jgi:STE24 endopeptidase
MATMGPLNFYFSDETSSKVKSYTLKKRFFFLVDTLLTAVFLLFFQFSGLSYWIYTEISKHNPNFYILNTLFVAEFTIISAIVFFPLAYWSHFRLEHQYDLSNQSFWNWIWDGVKSFALRLLFSIIAINMVYLFLREFPNTWWLWSTAFYFFFTIFLSRIGPTLIMPLFYRLKPLADSDLTHHLKKMAERVGARLIGVFQMDMSSKTKKANAMFTGIGRSKRIILGDTLLSNFANDEIEVVLAHEMGHYYHKHIIRFMIAGLGASLLGFYVVHCLLKRGLDQLGLQIHEVAGLPLFLFILFLFFLVLMPFQNTYSRKLERQADQFALEQTGMKDAFIRAMEKLGKQNMADIHPHPVIEFILYSHPSIQKRINFAKDYPVASAPAEKL